MPYVPVFNWKGYLRASDNSPASISPIENVTPAYFPTMFANIKVKLVLVLSLALPALATPQDYESWRRHEYHRHQHRATKTSTTSSSYSLTESSSSPPLPSSDKSIQSYSTGSALASASGSALSTNTAVFEKIHASASNTASAPNSTASTASGSTNPDFIRGINIGGWLLIEKSFNGKLFTGAFASAVDQWSFDSISGAGAALEAHYASYFNETHVSLLKSYGINALRIPIGFWAYDASGTPYYSQGPGKGADAYLEKAIGWAKAAGMKVWVDCHGSPGSQNGYDNSGHIGAVEWQTPANQAKSIAILKTMATKYGAAAYAGTVIGIELVNEPISWGANTPAGNVEFAKNGYTAVRADSANKDLMIVMHDAFEGPGNWTSWAASEGARGQAGIDTHMYQTLTAADQALTQDQHIQTACSRGIALASVNEKAPFFVGEWTATTNACVNPDGSSTAQLSSTGTKCTTPGCACVTDSPDKWTDAVITGMRKYVEAQLEVFEAYSSGYFLWTWTDPEVQMGSWSIVTGVEKGFIPSPLDDISKRKYLGQCLG